MNERRNLWTLVVDYRGGTYVRQASTPQAAAALVQMMKSLGEDPEMHAWRAELVEAIADATEAELVPVAGFEGVWCASLLDRSGELALCHLIATRPA